MHSFTLMTATLAAAVMASPAHIRLHRREDVIVTEVAYKTVTADSATSPAIVQNFADDEPADVTVVVTQVVTATAGQGEVAAPVASSNEPSDAKLGLKFAQGAGGWGHWRGSNDDSAAPSSAVEQVTAAAVTSPAASPATQGNKFNDQQPSPTQTQQQQQQQQQQQPKTTEAAGPIVPGQTAPPAAPGAYTAQNAALMPDSSLDSYKYNVILHHNIHRANHSAPTVTWDAGLAQAASSVAASCTYVHNTKVPAPGWPQGYGQNMAAGTEESHIGNVITGQFYNGEVPWVNGQYGNANMVVGAGAPAGAEVGHFTAVVWQSTTGVGCATVDCKAQGLAGVGSNVPNYLTICNYGPPGNFGGEFAENVRVPKGWASLSNDFSSNKY